MISRRESLTLPPVENLCHVTRVNTCLMLTSRCRKTSHVITSGCLFFFYCACKYPMTSIQNLLPLISDFLDLLQTSPPAAQESSVDDTVDLLGLNSDPEPPPVSSTPSSSAQGDQGGLKAASSNSDLLNDLFAPPTGQAGAVQEDLFFSGPTSAATPDSKRKNISISISSISISIHKT